MKKRRVICRALGTAVRARRVELGLSQEDLANRAGLHRNYVGGVERGERNVAIVNVHALARALGLRAGELVAEAERLSDVEEPPAR